MCEKLTASKVLKWLIGVKWMVWIGEWLNRQKLWMPRIACDDASTHGKFIDWDILKIEQINVMITNNLYFYFSKLLGNNSITIVVTNVITHVYFKIS